MKALHVISWILVIIGGLNWLLIGIGGDAWNVVAYTGGTVARIIYVIVGLAAIVLIFTHKKSCKECTSSSMPSQTM